MNIFKKIALIGAISLASTVASAELISTNWKINGDSRSTLDTISGLEWLDLSETINMSINNVSDLLNTTYSGWELATSNQVFDLYSNMYSDFEFDQYGHSYSSDLSEKNKVKSIIDMFGKFTSSNAISTTGIYLNDNPSLGDTSILNATSIYFGQTSWGQKESVNMSVHAPSGGWSHSTKSLGSGVFLVSTGGTTLSSINNPDINANANVPLPATLGLLGLSIAGLSFRRKIK
jgi:hypothetical protein